MMHKGKKHGVRYRCEDGLSWHGARCGKCESDRRLSKIHPGVDLREIRLRRYPALGPSTPLNALSSSRKCRTCGANTHNYYMCTGCHHNAGTASSPIELWGVAL